MIDDILLSEDLAMAQVGNGNVLELDRGVLACLHFPLLDDVAFRDIRPNHISWIYGIGVIFFLGKLVIELTSLKFLFNKHQYYKRESFVLIETNDSYLPLNY